MKIVVIGAGHVGLVTAAVFAEMGHTVVCADSDHEKIARLRSGYPWFFEPGLEELVLRNSQNSQLSFILPSEYSTHTFSKAVTFVCVGTPQKEGGEADLSYVESTCREIAPFLTDYALVVEKSTVPVSTGSRMLECLTQHVPKNVQVSVASCPEFLREGTAVEDARHPERLVFGVSNSDDECTLRTVYKWVPERKIFVTDIKTAEISKHACNSFLAMKISYANLVAQACAVAGADSSDVMTIMGMDKRIGWEFLKFGIGYGGYCFPKDILAFSQMVESLDADPRLLNAVQIINQSLPGCFVDGLERVLWNLSNKTLAVFGVSFKGGTDDLRESPAMNVLKALPAGVVVRIYDPCINDNPNYFKSAVEAAKGADAILLLTDHPAFRELHWEDIRSVMGRPLVFDGRNFLKRRMLLSLGFYVWTFGHKSWYLSLREMEQEVDLAKENA